MARPRILPNARLVRALKALADLTSSNQFVVRGRELKSTDRRLLQDSGYLREILKGWYFVSNPAASSGDTTLFFANFWEYLGYYLSDRFGDSYCLNPEGSLLRHAQYNIVPKQLIVMANVTQKVDLAFDHSIMIYSASDGLPVGDNVADIGGVRCMSISMALAKLPPRAYSDIPEEIQIGLSMLRDVDEVVSKYLINAAGVSRIVGGMRAIGRAEFAIEVESILEAQGRALLKTDNPFNESVHVFGERSLSPVYARVKAMWSKHAPQVRIHAPAALTSTMAPQTYYSHIVSLKVEDAYHSLSIERYRVTPELIRKVAEGQWMPNDDPADKQQLNAMAAKGYLEAFTVVRDDAVDAFTKREQGNFNAGQTFKTRHRIWFAKLFSSSVEAGILPADALAGYRRHMVFLQGSSHAPPHYDYVSDGMTALVECLIEEPCAFTRAVLGHWLFGFVHPYMDGNGRIARFTMNVMLASGGYPWTIIYVEDRDRYMAALEEASVNGDIQPFLDFIVDSVIRSQN